MGLRQENIDRLKDSDFDVLIVGSGINGAVSAAALAGRGIKVALVDERDFAGFTSQHSSNLVWGGIKYMENYEFGLVNSLCKSRNELLRSFPSTVKEIRFLTTLSKGFRFPSWIMIIGTWLYWLFGRSQTRIPRLLNSKQIKSKEPLVNVSDSLGGIEYSDAYLHDNDARFVFNFVRSAMSKGCVAANYVKMVSAKKTPSKHWEACLRDEITNEQFELRAKILINATGAFVDNHNSEMGIDTPHNHLFSKGIHLIVPKLSRGKRVMAFFADDGRLFFAIPMANCTCIGTTDTIVDTPTTVVTPDDREFVLSNINARLDLSTPLNESDIISERCGVRPLAVKKGKKPGKDFMQMSRRHVVETSTTLNQISIFGGKLTDCLNVGEEICSEVENLGIPLNPLSGKWYGEPPQEVRTKYFKQAYRMRIDQIIANDTGEILSERLWRRYGENAVEMLNAIEADPSMGEPVIAGAGLRRCELGYLAKHEMIVHLEDYLRRRSKLELVISKEQLKGSPGLMEICEIVFGDQSVEKYNEYFELNN